MSSLRSLATVVLRILITIGLLLTMIFLALPHILNHLVLPEVARRLPVEVERLALSSITLSSVSGTAALHSGGRPLLDIPRFELHLTPKGLAAGRIDRLVLRGPRLHLMITDGRPVLPAAELPASGKTAPGAGLPFGIETIVVDGLRLDLGMGDDSGVALTMDAEARLDYRGEGVGRLVYTGFAADLALRADNLAAASLHLRGDGDGYRTRGEVAAARLDSLGDLHPALGRLGLRGSLAASGSATLAPDFAIEEFRLDADIRRLAASLAGGVEFGGGSLTLGLAGDDAGASFRLSGIELVSPLQAAAALTGSYRFRDHSFAVEGRVKPLAIGGELDLKATGRREAETTVGRLALRGESGRLANEWAWSGFAADIDFVAGSASRFDISARLAEGLREGSETSVREVSFRQQLAFPWRGRQPTGSLEVGALIFRGEEVGTIAADLHLDREQSRLAATLMSPWLGESRLACTAAVDRSGGSQGNCSLPPTALSSAKLPGVVALPADLHFLGELSAEFDFRTVPTLQGSAELRLSLREVAMGGNSATGIDCSVFFPDLARLESAPSQLCTIAAVDAGKLHFSDGRLRFRIESPASVFLESGRFRWCGGTVDTGGLRLTSTSRDLETTLYCDRLNLALLLTQFGIDGTEGEGSLNGRLPLKYQGGKIVIDDGFLFSTPGISGIVRFTNTDQVRAGMAQPEGSAYLDYTLRSLENFAYNWTKFTFNSGPEELLVVMQLDGEPARPLPFGYRGGAIVPVADGPGIQHPIRLDVNFRLPLREMLQYGGNLQSLME